MNPIDAVKMPTQTLALEKSVNQKGNQVLAKETNAFAALIQSLSLDNQTDNEHLPQEELLKLVEEALSLVQALSAEEQDPEQQEMMGALFQMLSLQTIALTESLEGTSMRTGQEKLVMNHSNPDKLMALLEKMNQEIQKLVTTKPGQAGDPQEFVAIKGLNNLSDPNKVEQVFKQFATLIQQMETDQQTAKSAEMIQRLEQIVQQISNLVLQGEEAKVQNNNQQRNTLFQLNNETPDQGAEQTVHQGRQLSNQQEGTSQSQQQAPQQERGFQSQSPEGSQPITNTSFDVKTSSNSSQRLEPITNGQTATARMSNLIEDLGEVFRGSLRLNASQEGTQLRVNIFPEHLGHLDIRLTEVEGKIAAQIFTSNLVAKEALDLQVNQLRNALIQQGVSIEKIEITQQTLNQSLGQQNEQANQRFLQQQQRQGDTSRNRNGYQRYEEEAETNGHNPYTDEVATVNYTI